MPIYTRTGDKGETSLFSGKRVLKSALRVESYGTVDELNAILGVVSAHIDIFPKASKTYLLQLLHSIQNNLFHIGSYLADLPDALDDVALRERINDFEREIDSMTEKMPKLTNFILPGGGKAGAFLQHARTVARRAERQLVKLAKEEKIDDSVIAYVNRLSDLLFTMSRFANFIEKKKETIWSR